MSEKPLRVLVVDDSAYIRKVFSDILRRDPTIQVVGTARNGQDALEKTFELQPDVVILDVFMPELDGVGYLREQMKRRRIPVVLVSSAGESEDVVLAALEAGGVEFIQKPTARASEQVLSIAEELVQKVREVGRLTSEKLNTTLQLNGTLQTFPAPSPVAVEKVSGRVGGIVIGLSTGGPQALRYLLPLFPTNFPIPLAVVLHMPAGYTAPFASRLNDTSQLEVLEAREGMEMKPGRAIIAMAGRHLHLLRENPTRVICHLDKTSVQASPHIPSVDVLFRSAASAYGDKALGLVLTGMGSDGREGAAWIKAEGGQIFAEAEQTCVVFGMPRSVIESGLSDRIIPLHEIYSAILEVV